MTREETDDGRPIRVIDVEERTAGLFVVYIIEGVPGVHRRPLDLRREKLDPGRSK